MVSDEMMMAAVSAYVKVDKKCRPAAMRAALEAALSTDAEPVKTDDTVEYRWDGIAGKMRYYGSSAPNGWVGDEQQPSVAEQIADTVLSWMVKYDLLDAGNEYQATDILAVLDDFKPSYHTTSPSPSVAVKALEWEDDGISIQAMTACGFSYGVFCVDWEGEPYWQVSCLDGRFANEGKAKAAAQADYATRILSALSAQVQDVAETTTRFHIEWIAGARPPVHPKPMTGRTTFETFDRALKHMRSQADDARFVSLYERRTTVVSIDRSEDMRAMLSAAPAAKLEEKP